MSSNGTPENGTPRVLTALVTGSTKANGIGLAIGKCLAKNHGMNVILHDIVDSSSEQVRKCRGEIESYKVLTHYIQADLSSDSGVQTLCDDVDKICPDGIDVLVNNAGRAPSASLVENMSLQEWEFTIHINVTAPFLLIKHFVSQMKNKSWGRIINICSYLGIRATARTALYASTKHGLVGLTKVVALEIAESGVTCNAICPGWVDTDICAQFRQEKHDGGASKEEAKKTINNPTGKLVTTEQVAEAVSFFCSRASDMTNGSIFSIDGGTTAS